MFWNQQYQQYKLQFDQQILDFLQNCRTLLQMKSKSNKVFPGDHIEHNDKNIGSLAQINNSFMEQPSFQMADKAYVISKQQAMSSLQSQSNIQNNRIEISHQVMQQKDGIHIKRKQQKFVMYLIIMLFSLLVPLLYTFYLIQDDVQGFDHQTFDTALYSVYISVFLMAIFFNILNSCILLEGNIKYLVSLYFMLDAIFTGVVIVFCIQIAVIYLEYQVQDADMTLNTIWLVLSLVNIVSMTGNFRVMMKTCIWKKWQTIIYKLILIFSCLFYGIVGCNLLLQGKPQNDQETSLLIQFYVLQVLAYFALFIELISKMSDFDGTAELNSVYILQDQQQEDQETSRILKQHDKEIQQIKQVLSTLIVRKD